ncbi:hypothetical protein AB9K26_06155 [Psychroserpens sp. XS_ASV72]|uniref:hypothetical protein n=1 Tax=Psychroserpens sp. XS_ASV72 TaxID=3241293 RepID=UPI0035140D56
MKFSLQNLLGKTKDQPIENTDSVEAIIQDIENNPFAISESNVLYAGLNELGGYYFFQTVVVGSFKIKVKQGASIDIKGPRLDLKLQSDMLELESDHTDVKGRWITKIDFQINEADASKIDRTSVEQMVLNCKKENIVFSKYESIDEEEWTNWRLHS